MSANLTIDELRDGIASGVKAALQDSLKEAFAEFTAKRDEIIASDSAIDEKLKQQADAMEAKINSLVEDNEALKREITERNFQPIMDQADYKHIRMPIGLDALVRTPQTPAEKAGQIFSDQLYLLGHMLQGTETWSKAQMAENLMATAFMKNALNHWPELKRAIDTATAGSGLEWVPQGYSSQMIDAVYIATRVPALFPVIGMPTATYTSPVALNRPQAYKATEGVDRTLNTRSLTDNVVFNAKPIAVYVTVTQEATEDMILPILSWLTGEMSAGIAEGVEECILNGDTTATHMDTDIEAAGASAVQTCWDGLRHRGLGVTGCKVDISTFNADVLLTLKSPMGKYGLNPDDLAWLFGPGLLNKLLLLRDAQNNLLVTTLDKYGPQATVVTGEIAKLFGIPVIPSAAVREDTDSTGVNGASGNTYKTCNLVYRRAWFLGDRKRVVLESDKNIVNQTYRLVANARYDFEHVYGDTDKTTMVGYKG